MWLFTNFTNLTKEQKYIFFLLNFFQGGVLGDLSSILHRIDGQQYGAYHEIGPRKGAEEGAIHEVGGEFDNSKINLEFSYFSYFYKLKKRDSPVQK